MRDIIEHVEGFKLCMLCPHDVVQEGDYFSTRLTDMNESVPVYEWAWGKTVMDLRYRLNDSEMSDKIELHFAAVVQGNV